MFSLLWASPALMIWSLLAGSLGALSHHLYYASLDRKDASTILYSSKFLGMDLSIQQLNIAAGTTFTFLVRACLLLAISTSYFQILMWHLSKARTTGTRLSHLDNMWSALHDLSGLLSTKTWWKRLWLWILAFVPWMIFVASIIPPATLSVGVQYRPPVFRVVPNVQFESLNLLAPMTPLIPSDGLDHALWFSYTGPSPIVQKIASAVASTGSILPVVPPSPNATWSLRFNGPTLECDAVPTQLRQSILDNILNYTYGRYKASRCESGPGYTSWHPKPLQQNDMPFIMASADDSRGALNNLETIPAPPEPDSTSVFFAITPTVFSDSMCKGTSRYNNSLAEYRATATVLKCDVFNSTYWTNFVFRNGIQQVDILRPTKITGESVKSQMIVQSFVDASDKDKSNPQPIPCPLNTLMSNGLSFSEPVGCLYDPHVMSTLSYMAITDAFKSLVTGILSKEDRLDAPEEVTSTTQLLGTILAEAPELKFLTSNLERNGSAPAQMRAVNWVQKPFSGLYNAELGPSSMLPFQQALEQLFQNITISLMSARELQPNASSAYYPNQTEVQLNISENVYVYSASKLWLAYGLSIAVTAVIVILGEAAVLANKAYFSNRFSTILRLSRGAQLSKEIDLSDLSGHDPLPDYASKTMVRFPLGQKGEMTDSHTYMLPDERVKENPGVIEDSVLSEHEHTNASTNSRSTSVRRDQAV